MNPNHIPSFQSLLMTPGVPLEKARDQVDLMHSSIGLKEYLKKVWLSLDTDDTSSLKLKGEVRRTVSFEARVI